MASLIGAVTALGLMGVSHAGLSFNSEYQTSPRPYTVTFTQLGLDGGVAARNVNFSGKTEETTATLDVTDTASISVTEGPIDTNEIVTYDSASISVSENSSLLNFYGVTDTVSLALNESLALNIAGVSAPAVTDTASVSVTDASAINVSVSVTDTASVSVTDSSSVAVATEVLAATDTASISISDLTALDVFSGSASFVVDDVALLSVVETATVYPLTIVESIRFVSKVPQIRFRKL
jgi:hypothetical protein